MIKVSITHRSMQGPREGNILDGQMLVPTCMLEEATSSFMECHAEDPLHALTERLGHTLFFPISKRFGFPLLREMHESCC